MKRTAQSPAKTSASLNARSAKRRHACHDMTYLMNLRMEVCQYAALHTEYCGFNDLWTGIHCSNHASEDEMASISCYCFNVRVGLQCLHNGLARLQTYSAPRAQVFIIKANSNHLCDEMECIAASNQSNARAH